MPRPAASSSYELGVTRPRELQCSVLLDEALTEALNAFDFDFNGTSGMAWGALGLLDLSCEYGRLLEGLCMAWEGLISCDFL